MQTLRLEEWSEDADDGFAKDPPNATVSALSADASAVRDAVVVLKSLYMDGDGATFDVQMLEGDRPARMGPRCSSTSSGCRARRCLPPAWYAGAAGTAAAAGPYYYPPSYGYPCNRPDRDEGWPATGE